MQIWAQLLPVLGLWALTVMSPGPDTQAVDAGAAVKLVVVLAVGAIAGAWYMLIAATVCIAPVARFYRRGRRVVEATAGMLFLGLGTKLAADR